MNTHNEWDNMEWDETLNDFVPKKSSEPSAEQETAILHTDCNGNVLATGDSVILTKDLPVKGSSLSLKQGTRLKGIKIIDDEEHVEYKEGKTVIWVKKCFIKKA